MIETYATATDFRTHFSQIANCVSLRQERCIVMRHGRDLVALIGWEDIQFLRKYKPLKVGPPGVDAFSPGAAWPDQNPAPPPPPEPEPLPDDPFHMGAEEILPLYDQVRQREGESYEVDTWLIRARIMLREMRCIPPGDPYFNKPPSDDG